MDEFEKNWKRLKYDYDYGLFAKHPYEFMLYEKALKLFEKWIMPQFESNSFNARKINYCDVPKSGGLIRPGAYFTILNHLFYTYLVSQSYKGIFETIKWSQGKIDFAYGLTGDMETEKWLKNQFKCWEEFRNESLKTIDKGYPYVIITDITGYYENIDHQILYSDLKDCKISDNICISLKKTLKKWSIIQGKGLPQGCSASHILAKLYLNAVDLALSNKGIIHQRYVDDIRIYCKSKSEAKTSLVHLIKLLRQRGLNLQSAKTKILTSKEARSEIEGVKQIIDNISEQIKNNEKPTKTTITVNSPSLSEPLEITKYETIKEPETIRVLEETFRSYFLENSSTGFDKSLFHYLLNRLAFAENDFALEYCLSILDKHPEETEAILKYITKLNKQSESLEQLVEFLNSKLAAYAYQNYQLIKWINENFEQLESDILKEIRTFSIEHTEEKYLQTELNRFFGKFGNIADIDNIADYYSSCESELERAETIMNLKRMETSKRNQFFSTVKDEGELIEIAIKHIKEN